MVLNLKIEDIIIRRELSPRKTFNEETIERYAHIIDDLPPIVVQKSTHVLIDGFYRVFARQQRGDLFVPEVEEIDIPDSELFAEACRRNLVHGVPLTKDERNEAIVRLYRDGLKQEALAEMFGAHERTEKISTVDISHPLTPKHEQLIRRAPKPLQDIIAEVILTREEVRPPEYESQEFPIATSRRKLLTVRETNVLVDEIVLSPENAPERLEYLLDHPLERGIVNSDSVDPDAKTEIIARWWGVYRDICELRGHFDLDEIAFGLIDEMNSFFEVDDAREFIEELLAEMERLSANDDDDR